MGVPSQAVTRNARVALFGLAIALVIGAFVRLWALPAQSLYLDEAFVLEAARMPTPAMLQFLASNDAHPPLFYLLAHVAVTHLQWPSTWYRFLTAPFGLLTILCAWGIARRTFGDVAAAVAAIVVATEPTLVLFDRMFRMYPVLTALSAASFWLMLSALSAQGVKRRWLWAVCALVLIVLPSVQYLGALIVASQAAYALFDVRRRWPIIAAAALAVVPLAPWWWAIQQQLPQAGYAGGHAIGSAWSLARDVLGYGVPIDWYRHTAFDVPYTLAVVAIIASAVWIARGGIVGLYLVPLALQFIETFVFHRNFVYGRYLLYLIPAYGIACGAVSAALLGSKVRIAAIALIGAALAVNGVAVTNLLLDKFYKLSDWNIVETILATNERPSDVIVFDQVYTYFVFRSSPAVSGHGVIGPEQPQGIPPVERWIDGHRVDRVWYVENQRFYSDPQGDIKKHLDATRHRLRVWLELRADPSNIVYVALYGPVERARR